MSNHYSQFLLSIKERICKSQYEALKAVNNKLIVLYWDIGGMIVDRQKKHGWGKAIVENLAKDLQKEFPGIRGFSMQNLWYMRQFYMEYQANVKLQPLVGEISWTKDVLIHQIEAKSYEKTMLNQTNFNKTLNSNIRHQAKLAVKDEYSFDFLELGEEHSERELESALMLKMDRFLREMGGSITFAGSQRRINI